MGAQLTEFVFENTIRDGLGELRTTPSKLDDLFSKFKEAMFNNQYGQAKIDEIKTYIQTNQVKIVHAWQQVPTAVPCISIQLTRADESEDIQNLGNNYPDEDYTKEPTVYVPIATPGTYDTVTGKLTIVNAGADLSSVCPGLVFIDASSVSFEIGSGNSNMSGAKYINIGSGKTPDLSAPGKIVSPVDFGRTERRQIRLRETILLGCHAKNDIHLAKYLYYILFYILKSRQDSLINRGIELDRGTGSIFDRVDEFEGQNVFSRMIEVNCLTEFVWNQGDVLLFDCFDLNVKAPNPNPDSPTATKVNTSPED